MGCQRIEEKKKRRRERKKIVENSNEIKFNEKQIEFVFMTLPLILRSGQNAQLTHRIYIFMYIYYVVYHRA